jgi:guanylate kinase
MTGKLVILTGFSGSGKDTLMNMLLETRPNFQRLITHTSRSVRPGEKHGKDYYFVSRQEFEKMIQKNMFLEHVMYGSHYKGTSKEEFQKVLLGQNIIWRIDMSRAAIIEDTFLEKFDTKTASKLISVTKKVIITVSPDEALERFKKREGQKANLTEFQKRLDRDLAIWNKLRNHFPHVVENITGKVSTALEEIIEIIGN